MEKSASIKSLAVALAALQAELPVINLDREVEVKTKAGGTYRFRYATFRHILDTVRPLLAKHKFSFSQPVEPDGSVTTIIMHESGEYISANLSIKGEQTPQGIGSAITYTKRYAFCAILGIVADDDDDGNGAEGNDFKTDDNAKPWLNKNSQQWAEAVKYLKNGGKIDKITEKYKISKANREELLTESL